VWARDAYSTTVDPNLVVATDPRPNTSSATDLIVVWVSIGSPPAETVPPSVPDMII
jgi:beta-lactam-binding protein with PASTA domain